MDSKPYLIEIELRGIEGNPDEYPFNIPAIRKLKKLKTADTVSPLYRHLKTVKGYKKPGDFYFLRAESFYNVATYMDKTGYLAGYGGKSLHERSHGEAFLATLTMKLRGKGFYLFDEPEAALSAIHQLVLNESQFIIATHLPILLAYPRSSIMLMDEE